MNSGLAKCLVRELFMGFKSKVQNKRYLIAHKEKCKRK